MVLNRDAIAALIPHAGAMCLLDRVQAWDDQGIRCVAAGHADAANPLRVAGSLPALCGIEYAAQAMAVHGGLRAAAGARPRSGYLASLREVDCKRARLDDLAGELCVEATRLLGDDSRVIYQFIVRVGVVEVLSGRATVVLNADAGAGDAPGGAGGARP
jgi:predicted hotdog family 3-hydroxylacyl-ACP dehydratase